MKSAAARRASDEARAASGSPIASGVDQARRDEDTIIDGFFNFLAWGTHELGFNIRGLQNGSIQRYAFVFFLGLLALLLILIF